MSIQITMNNNVPHKLLFSSYTVQIWMKEVCHIFENFEILVFFNSGKQVLFLPKVLAKNYKGKFFSREACAIKFPLWKQYCNWKSEYGKYVLNIRPLSRFTLTCFHYPDFDIHLLPFSRLYYGTYFLVPDFKYQLMCPLTCNLYILPI